MILAEVEETVTTVELDEETFEEIYKVRHFYIHLACLLAHISDISS